MATVRPLDCKSQLPLTWFPIRYMDWVVKEDMHLFPLPDGEVVPGMSELLQAATSRVEQTPAMAPATSLVSGPVVASYDSVDLGA